MPTYEYRCPNGHAFERFSPRMTAGGRARCPRCHKLAERVISGGAGLVFKGSGFYATDYKRAGEKRAETETKPAESKPADSKTPDKSKPSGSPDK
jgi:putative FmdB family regulatory protein